MKGSIDDFYFPSFPRRGLRGGFEGHEIKVGNLYEYRSHDFMPSLKPSPNLSLEGRGIRGLPIGNVTSQIFANIYLNELDQFVKHRLKVKYYFRYADDFAIIHQDTGYLKNILKLISEFLEKSLFLRLHPSKVRIRKFRQGFDFLGYVSLPYYKVLRTKTKKRMIKKLTAKRKLLDSGAINEEKFQQSFQSYLGILKHCNGHKIKSSLNGWSNISRGNG